MRLSLLLAACLAGFVPVIQNAAAKDALQTIPPPVDQELARDIFKGLVGLNTTHSHGTTPAAEAIEGWLVKGGLYDLRGDSHRAAGTSPGSGNLVVRLRALARPTMPSIVWRRHSAGSRPSNFPSR